MAITAKLTTEPVPAVDLSQHLSQLARERLFSPMKGLYPYFARPNVMMLAGGLPTPDYFPFESLSAEVLLPTAFSPLDPSGMTTRTMVISKHERNPSQIQLSKALQYSTGVGDLSLAKFIREFTARVFTPAYSDWSTLLNGGATDAWSKICTTLCERGDGILCEEYTFPATLAAAWPSGFRPVAVGLDEGGMVPGALESLLANWNTQERGGMKRPSVLYVIPITQNPTGTSMTACRKRQIYEVCVKYDIVIVEDDPYYFLQAGRWKPEAERATELVPTSEESDGDFLASLIPSFLKYDRQGRVIRIDTFSKTICPGARLGWITCNPLFYERLLLANESTLQSPCGFSQALIAKLLVDEWKMEGYLTWLKGMKAEYRDRRDSVVDAIVSATGADAALEGGTMAISNGKSVTKLLSFVPPEGGMFIWLRVRTSTHPAYPRIPASTLVHLLWEDLVEAGPLLAPGTMFSSATFGPGSTSLNGPPKQELALSGGDGFFRIAFSTAPKKEMSRAMTIIGEVTKAFWQKNF